MQVLPILFFYVVCLYLDPVFIVLKVDSVEINMRVFRPFQATVGRKSFINTPKESKITKQMCIVVERKHSRGPLPKLKKCRPLLAEQS